MDVQIIQKTLQQQKLQTIFLVDVHCQLCGLYDHIDSEHTLYRGKDCMKNFCTFLKKFFFKKRCYH